LPLDKKPPKPSCFSTTIDLSLKEKLRNDLESQNFSFTRPPYTIFCAKKGKISLSLYESGKLTIQGKDKDEFIEFYIEPEILHELSYTHPENDIDLTPRMGVDEAGKGDFFGPLCIASVFAEEKTIHELVQMGVKDSKTLTDKRAHELAKKIKILCPYAIVQIFPEKYNQLYEKFTNLNHLLAWGHATAIFDLYQKTHCTYAIIDQFADKKLVENAVKKKEIPMHLDQRHKGEQDVVVAAASILARTAFLDGLDRLSRDHLVHLPKGASKEVIQAGKKIVLEQGQEILSKVGKLHFKTFEDILQAL
jgi:ribonuclease HIII